MLLCQSAFAMVWMYLTLYLSVLLVHAAVASADAAAKLQIVPGATWTAVRLASSRTQRTPSSGLMHSNVRKTLASTSKRTGLA
jgi:hypothetical protein